MGSGITWINAMLMLQTLAENEYLDRVLDVQYASSTMLEASIAYLIGSLQDAGRDKHSLALLSAGISSFLVCFWAIYFYYYGCLRHGGAAPAIATGYRPQKRNRSIEECTLQHSPIWCRWSQEAVLDLSYSAVCVGSVPS